MNPTRRFFLAIFTAVALVACQQTPASAQPEAVVLQPVLLQMIRDDSVHAELSLSAAQKQSVYAALAEVDGRWFRARIKPVAQREAEIDTLTAELKEELSKFLSSDQQLRLRQLQCQAHGTRMVIDGDVRGTLNLTDSQLSKMTKVFLETDRIAADVQKKMSTSDISSAEAARKIGDAKTEERRQLISTLTEVQSAKIARLTGKSFDFSKVKRTYPRAPEFTSGGASWLQGGQQKLEDLRGSVVAVHFYAFQCINCQRNLPHYTAWHKDYADRGLKIIGIQTPETSAESDAKRVASAATGEGILYPVMMDGTKSNWDQWSNTMWPTVYLIDKKGFIRRWWQGEMNWNGNPGEADMRQTIEQLLAEND